MNAETSLEGLVLKINGELILFVPLGCGGSETMECSRSTSEAQGDFLKIAIPEWLDSLLHIVEGDLLCMDHCDGKFHFPANSPCPVPVH